MDLGLGSFLLASYHSISYSSCCVVVCSRCRFTHDIAGYLAAKPRDIRIPKIDEIPSSPPWVPNFTESSLVNDQYPSLDSLSECPVYLETGFCRYAS